MVPRGAGDRRCREQQASGERIAAIVARRATKLQDRRREDYFHATIPNEPMTESNPQPTNCGEP